MPRAQQWCRKTQRWQKNRSPSMVPGCCMRSAAAVELLYSHNVQQSQRYSTLSTKMTDPNTSKYTSSRTSMQLFPYETHIQDLNISIG